MKKPYSTLMLLTALSLVGPTLAQTTNDHDSHHPVANQLASADLTPGEIRKIDKDAQKITIKHGAIKNLDMPPMTMVFLVEDGALLDKAMVGDKVQFKVIKKGSAFVITEIQSAK
jgi:Cu(I)/Ag(I) efflux system protein CusF